MTAFTIELSPRAKADLKNIHNYTHEAYGAKQTQSYLSNIEKCINRLFDNPEIGRKRDDVKPDYRSVKTGKHVIFYTIKSRNIQIIGIVHERMDVKNISNNCSLFVLIFDIYSNHENSWYRPRIGENRMGNH